MKALRLILEEIAESKGYGKSEKDLEEILKESFKLVMECDYCEMGDYTKSYLVAEVKDGDNARYFKYCQYSNVRNGDSAVDVGYVFEGIDNIPEVHKTTETVVVYE
jgi:hypothetical protein